MIRRTGPLAVVSGILILCFLFEGLCSKAMCRENGTSERATPGNASSINVYRAPLLNNPKTLDPAYIQDIYGILLVHQLFDGLVQFSRDLFVIPALAETWQVEDHGKVYRFLLRKNAVFHDGHPVTSRDVVFSLTRLFRVSPPPTVLPYLMKILGAKEYMDGKAASIEGLQPIDDWTIDVRLEQPYVPFLVALGMHNTSIVPARLAVHEEVFRKNPVGSGAFKLVSWNESKNIKLERNPEYFGGRSRLDGIDFIIYPGIDIEQVWRDFQAAKLDEMPFYPQFRERLNEIQGLQWLRRPSLSIQFYGFNTNHPRLRDPQLRAALSRAIDRKKLADVVYGGALEPATGILPPGLPGYQPDTLERQNELRDASSGPADQKERPGVPLKPLEVVSNSQSSTAQAELGFVRESWKELGFQMTPKYIPDWGQFETYLQSDELQIYRYAWFADIPDPDDFLRVLFASGSPLNFMRYRNTQVDEMLENASRILDPIQRARTYRDIEVRIMRDTPAIPLTNLTVDMVYQPYVRDIEVTALGVPSVSYHRVWLDRQVHP